MKCLAKKYFVFILYLFISFNAYSQRDLMRFKRISTINGLSSDFVNCFMQDNQGFMWIGTRDGLNRYDGNEFKTFVYSPYDTNTISDNSIESIFQDKKGYIWVGTHYGINILNPIDNSIIRLLHEPNNPNSVGHNEIRDVVQYNDTTYWIATYGGGIDKLIISFEPSLNYKFTHYNDSSRGNQFIPNRYVNDLFIDSDHILWAGLQRDGIFVFSDEDQEFFTPSYIEKIKTEDKRETVNMIMEDKEKNIWFGTWEIGFFKIDKKFKTIENYNFDIENSQIFSNYIARCLTEDNKGNIWLGSFGQGLIRFNKETEEITKYQNDPHRATSLGHSIVWNLFIDNSGTLWIGTWGAGINILDLNEPKFIHYSEDPNLKSSLLGNTVNHMFVDKNEKIWISTFEAGINIFDHKTDEFKHIKVNDKEPTVLQSNTIWCTYIDPDAQEDIVWIASDVDLIKYNFKKNTYKRYKYNELNPNNNKAPSITNIRFIYKDSFDTLWLGTYGGGLNKFNKETEIFTYYLHDPKNPESIADNAIFSIFEDSYHNLWIGTGGQGLDLFDRKTQTFKHYVFDMNNSSSISGNNVLCIFESKEKELWIGTSAGLSRYNRGFDNFTTYNSKDGFANNTINSIEEDDQNNLWLSNTTGITKFNPQSKEVKNYGKEDGLNNTFVFNSSSKTSDGYMLFGGSNGFDLFHPDQITESNFNSPIRITNFRLFDEIIEINKEYNGKILLTKSIEYTDKISITSKQKEFSFDFASLHFPAAEKNIYKYKLDGYNDNWILTNASRRFALYSNLEPGKYTFRVRGTNNDGIWNEEEDFIEIVILPPFYKTLFFRIASILIVFGLIYFIYWYRINTIKLQKVVLEKEVNDRTLELKEKNSLLRDQAVVLNETNVLLEERQQQIEEQAEELMTQRDSLEVSNQKLEESNATKDKFFSIIAHDIKNPFNTILGYTDLLKFRYKVWSDEKRIETIDLLHNTSKNTFNLLENLLQWSRSQQGVMEFRPDEINLKLLIEKILKLLNENAEQKDVYLSYRFKNGVFNIIGDDNMLEIIIRNLIINAIKFSNSGSHVQVLLEKANSNAVIHVIDEGVGMTTETLDKLFKTVSNRSTAGTNNEKGTGLGLILVKEFVEKHNGVISVKSSPGKGSVFSISIPQ